MKQKSKVSKKEVDAMVFDLMDALRSPIITHGAWPAPDRIRTLIPEMRLIALMKNEKMATEEEVVIYLSTASLEAPLTSEWTDIFTHLGCMVEKKHFQRDCFDDIPAPRKLSDHLIRYELNPLRIKIYEKRRKVLKERMKQEKKQKEVNIAEEIYNKLEYEQLKLF